MQSTRKGSLTTIAITLLALLIVLAGCQLPFLSRPAGGTPATTATGGESSQPTPAGTQGSIPSNVLTQVAATIFAPLQGTWTAQAETGVQAAPTTGKTQVPPTAGISAPTLAATQSGPGVQPTQGQPATVAPKTPFPTPVLPATVQSQPTAGVTQSSQQPQILPTYLPQPTIYAPVNPPSGYVAQPGKAFSIAGVNLPSCGGGLTANFMILNNSGYTFESLSLQITDLSAGTDLFGPLISDAPFMFDDRACVPGGYSHLASGYAGVVGAATNVRPPTGHTLQANFLFCTKTGLSGRCYPRSVEFIVP